MLLAPDVRTQALVTMTLMPLWTAVVSMRAVLVVLMLLHVTMTLPRQFSTTPVSSRMALVRHATLTAPSIPMMTMVMACATLMRPKVVLTPLPVTQETSPIRTTASVSTLLT